MMSTGAATIPGYTYGSAQLARSPVSEEDLRLLEATLLWTPDDERYLRMAGDVLRDQVDAVLDLWYGYVGSHPHLVHYFAGPDGQPDGRYLDRVRARFGQWIRDLCERPRDRAWLDYQEEIGQRHTNRKNATDDVESVPVVSLRYLIAFVYPITATIREFLAAQGHGPEDVDGMFHAWFKSVVLTVVLWSRPYAEDRW
jgi:Protoglobin